MSYCPHLWVKQVRNVLLLHQEWAIRGEEGTRPGSNLLWVVDNLLSLARAFELALVLFVASCTFHQGTIRRAAFNAA